MTKSRWPILDPLDRRLNAWRPDLADANLQGRVTAQRFVAGNLAHVSAPWLDLRREPRPECSIGCQLLQGAGVRIFEEVRGWAWVKALDDGYVGWTEIRNLAPGTRNFTHIVAAPRTFVYPGPDLKFPAALNLSMGSRIDISGEATTRGVRYLLTSGGQALVARHLRPAVDRETDFVAVARRLLGTPYLWGGGSAFGVDCSGLVQLALRMCGHGVQRDSDMQAATLGSEIDPGADYRNLKRGDLVFWRGHVAIAEGDGNLLHANGYTMDVASEPLAEALARIETVFEAPIGVRRPATGRASTTMPEGGYRAIRR